MESRWGAEPRDAVQPYKCRLHFFNFLHCLQRTYCINWSLFRMHMPKRTIAYVEGNSCRDAYTFLKQRCTLWKAFALLCFVVCIYYSWLFWLKLCIYVGHWESCWECTAVAFVTEAAMFGFGKNKVWYLLQTWNIKNAKNGAHNAPLPFLCVMIKTYETAHSHSLPLSLPTHYCQL